MNGEQLRFQAAGQGGSNFWQNNSVGDILSGSGDFLGGLLGGIGAIKGGGGGILYAKGNNASEGTSTGNQQPLSAPTAKETNWMLWGGILLAVVVVIVLVIVLMRKK